MSENERKKIELPGSIVVRDLAQMLGSSPIQIIKVLMTNGVMANINQQIDYDTAAVVASECGFDAAPITLDVVEEAEVGEVPMWRQIILKEDVAHLVDRPPVVTILGHVDHGKTTLLDAIRHANVAGGEAGGITQHIGAYQVEHKGKLITFLDTPGHAAFTAMRARGAQGADVVVLVVAANDGVMPQTREAIAHARAARVPIIVALNKIDRPDANPDYVKQQLAENGLQPVEWDGQTWVVPVSAKQRTGLEDLLEAILMVTDSMDIRANPDGKVIGTVIEAQLDKSRGPLATLLVQNGMLKTGDLVVIGTASGKIRAMFDFRGHKIAKAGPATPVQVMGLSDVPHAGDLFQVFGTEREARALVDERKQAAQQRQAAIPKATLEELFDRYKAGELRDLRLIIKVDVEGSVDPIKLALKEIKSDEISINVLHAETGNITESDVMLAAASKAIVVGFNVQADTSARRLAEVEGVSIRLYSIIYRLSEDVEKALKGMLAPTFKDVQIGRADVLAIFQISKIGVVAGCRVREGEMRRNARVRLMRGSDLVFEGEMLNLKREKDNTNEVRQGFECGISLKNFNDIQVGDSLVCFSQERVLVE
ncbi:MAG TPA: translation initiation factor IF-2 [Anaerolineaceae bacterium]|nr:translation initiation factor IF-2 [Anaerolineaceae bacterium]